MASILDGNMNVVTVLASATTGRTRQVAKDSSSNLETVSSADLDPTITIHVSDQKIFQAYGVTS